MRKNGRIGLSQLEHQRAAGLLQRAYCGLRNVIEIINSRYSRTHRIKKELQASIASVRAAQIEMENAARAEHPDSRVVYIANDIKPSAMMEHAVATSGENVDLD